eukprot:3890712-Amphidinium_carterae.2
MQSKALNQIHRELVWLYIPVAANKDAAARKFNGPTSNFQDDLSSGKAIINPTLEVDDVQTLTRPHLDERMHPAPKVGLRTFSSAQHGCAKPRKDGQTPFATSQSFVLPRRTKGSFVALLLRLVGSAPKRALHQPSFLHKDYIV